MTTAVAVACTVAAAVLVGGRLRPDPVPRWSAVATRRPGRRRRLARWILVGSVVVAATTVGFGVPAAAIVAGVGLSGPLRRRRQRRRDVAAMTAALPDAVELLIVCLHAGRSPTQALIELAELAPPAVRPAFATIEQRLHRGASFAEAIDALTVIDGPLSLPVASALGAAVRDGLPLAPVLDRLAAEATAARRRAGEAAARRLPIQLTFPLVTCTLPSFVLLAVAPPVIAALSSLRSTSI